MEKTNKGKKRKKNKKKEMTWQVGRNMHLHTTIAINFQTPPWNWEAWDWKEVQKVLGGGHGIKIGLNLICVYILILCLFVIFPKPSTALNLPCMFFFPDFPSFIFYFILLSFSSMGNLFHPLLEHSIHIRLLFSSKWLIVHPLFGWKLSIHPQNFESS